MLLASPARLCNGSCVGFSAQWRSPQSPSYRQGDADVLPITRAIAPRTTASAHCDIPCGVYDPAQARIEAESCYKIIQKYNDSQDELFRTRCINVKEERAELDQASHRRHVA